MSKDYWYWRHKKGVPQESELNGEVVIIKPASKEVVKPPKRKKQKKQKYNWQKEHDKKMLDKMNKLF